MFVRIVLICAVFSALGCREEDKACPNIEGVFRANYTLLPPPADEACLNYACQCPVTPPMALSFDFNSDKDLFTSMMVRTDDMITTEILRKGCSMRVDRMATSIEGNSLWRIQGALDVIDSETLGGTMQRIHWNMGSTTCAANYEAMLYRDDGAIQRDTYMDATGATFAP